MRTWVEASYVRFFLTMSNDRIPPGIALAWVFVVATVVWLAIGLGLYFWLF